MTISALLKNQAYIDGAWVGEPKTPVRNPATGEEIACVPDLAVADVRQAVAAAHKAFPAWAKMLAKERSAVMRAWFNLILENTDALAEILTREMGKPLAEAKSEITYGAGFIEFYAEQAKRVQGDVLPPFQNGSRVLVLKQPLGVVAAITPWNFPNAMITRKIAPALAAGCTIILKPASATPLSALALAALAERAGMPKGVLNIVTSKDAAGVGKELAANELVRGIAFTGSTEVGRTLMAQAAGTIKKVSLELGGNAPFIVFDDADLDKAVEGAMASKYRASGQTCVCANRLFVQDKIHDAFAEKLKVAVGKLKIGNGMETGVTQGPLINEAAVKKVQEHIDDAVAKGAEILTGGKASSLGGTFFEPTILTGVTKEMRLMQEETFGPVAPLVKFTTDDEAIELANATPFGLAGYFYARDMARIWRAAEALEVGMVGVNTGLISDATVPFGGIKQSGLGREGSAYGIEEYVELKYMLMGGI